MTLRVHNTLTGKKEDFVPVREGKAGMYVCGVTVYDYCHVGHARAATVFDTIYRYLLYKGYDVTYVRNFTDIDDKIINRANEEKIPWQAVTEKYIRAFYEDMGRLNVAAPTHEPKATETIPEMIAMIAALVERGKAYELDGDVYYSVKAFEDYGQLSGKKIDDLIAGARVEVNERKRDPLDFALWKKSKPGEPFWESPWGRGRPGWHIECSAMSKKFLGDRFDIHGGGKDLVFPHHENEIAQSCGAAGHAPVKYWIHNGFVNINKEKMSKSLGNFFTIRDILGKYHPEALRLFLLSSHYRSPIDFSDQGLDEAEKTLDRYYDFFAETAKVLDPEKDKFDPVSEDFIQSHALLKKFDEAMDDDFNTAVALAHMGETLRTLNATKDEFSQSAKDPAKMAERPYLYIKLEAGMAALKETGVILGLFHAKPDVYKARKQTKKIEELKLDAGEIERLIAARNSARAAKAWDQADKFRDELSRMGVVLEDTPGGTVWKVK
ncbi:MAG: cysteine--tRNA ligase [Nitrospinae bacterium]|nr:cysteine--tRNA ligase [Nitrospinota bacterium]